MFGSMVSSIVIVCVHGSQLLQSSQTRYSRVMVSGHVSPFKLLARIEQISSFGSQQLSVADPPCARNSVQSIAGGGTSSGHCTVTSGGQLTSGGVVSTSVIDCSHVAELPHKSIHFHVRMNEPVPQQPAGLFGSGLSLYDGLLGSKSQLSEQIGQPVLLGCRRFVTLDRDVGWAVDVRIYSVVDRNRLRTSGGIATFIGTFVRARDDLRAGGAARIVLTATYTSIRSDRNSCPSPIPP